MSQDERHTETVKRNLRGAFDEMIGQLQDPRTRAGHHVHLVAEIGVVAPRDRAVERDERDAAAVPADEGHQHQRGRAGVGEHRQRRSVGVHPHDLQIAVRVLGPQHLVGP